MALKELIKGQVVMFHPIAMPSLAEEIKDIPKTANAKNPSTHEKNDDSLSKVFSLCSIIIIDSIGFINEGDVIIKQAKNISAENIHKYIGALTRYDINFHGSVIKNNNVDNIK